MKKRLLAIMHKNGKYLAKCETKKNGVLAYGAHLTNDFEHALVVDWDEIKNNDKNTESLRKWADAVDGKLVVISIDYTVAELGEDEDEN